MKQQIPFQNYIIILALFVATIPLNAQNLWGVDASVDVANAQFQNDFIETGTPGSYDITHWTALSIYDTDGVRVPGKAYWTRNTQGRSQGGYGGADQPITSPSQANGVAIFDSDFLDNGGSKTSLGSGTSPATSTGEGHRGELISPRIDLTGHTGTLLEVKFFSRVRNFNMTEWSVSFSVDDGANWGTAVGLEIPIRNTYFDGGFVTVALPSTTTQGVTNLAQCRLKFTFQGAHYIAMVDDVTIRVFEDETAPVFENNTPSISATTLSGATIATDIDEAGKIYYVVLADGATAPTVSEVKAGTGSGSAGHITSGNTAVTTGDFIHDFYVTGLTRGTSYDVYVVAEDDASTPNVQENVTKIAINTLSNTRPTFTSEPVNSAIVGQTYSYSITTNDADGDDVTITAATTLPTWLNLTDNGDVTTLAGSGSSGSTDANGTAASFNRPTGVAVDGSGNVYVADRDSHKIRKIALNGDVTTFAGSGIRGSTNANGTAASFDYPSGVAVDGDDNIYVTNSFDHKIRKIAPNGDVTTHAGSGDSGSTDANGTAASFNSPYGIAVDDSGNVYVADKSNHKIRMIALNGDVTTLAGSGGSGSTDANGTAASFNSPHGVAVDGSGNVYVSDTSNDKIRKIAPNGDVTTLAGSGRRGGTDANGTAATFEYPPGVAVDDSGNVYVADYGNHKIRKITTTSSATLTGDSTGKAGVHNVVLEANDGNGGVVQQSFTVTVNNPPGFTVSAVAGSGTTEAGGTDTFTVVLDAEPSSDVVIDVTSDDTGEVKVSNANLTFTSANWDTAQTVTVTGVDDNIVDATQTATITLAIDAASTDDYFDAVADQTVSVDNTNDDKATITVADVSQNEDKGPVTVIFTLDNAVDGGFTIEPGTSNGPATTDDNDYTAVIETLTFDGMAGETQSIEINIGEDTKVEIDEYFIVFIGELTPKTVNISDFEPPNIGNVTILNDDSATVTIEDVAVSEDTGTAEVTLTLNGEVDNGFRLDVSASNNTAKTADSDYISVADNDKTKVFSGSDGETKILEIEIISDSKVEADEIIDIAMLNLNVIRVSYSAINILDTSTVTILNDDSAAVTIEDVSGNEDNGDLTFTATLDNPVQGGFRVEVNSANGTAKIDDADYLAIAAETLTFTGTQGETQTFTLTPNVDNKVEEDETVTISQSNLGATSLAVTISDTAKATITNDDATEVTIDADVDVDEDASFATLTATLSNPVQGGFFIDVTTADGTAVAPGDYTAFNDQPNTDFSGVAGETQSILIPIMNDSQAEFNETFAVTLTSVSGTTLGSFITTTDTAQVTIINDDFNELTITGITGDSKVYDGTISASATGTKSLVGVVGEDDVSISGTPTYTFASANVGTGFTITTTGYTLGGLDASKYTLTQPTLSANITAAELTITGLTADNKVYDGTTTATASGAATLSGIIGADDVSIKETGVYTFANANVADGITVNTSGYTISGADTGNYTLTQPTLSANITAAELTITGLTAVDKVYDGTTAATASGTATLSGIIGADDVSIKETGVYTFASVNVADGITVNTSGYTINGDDSGNYALTQPTLSANITPAQLTVTPVAGQNKVYGSAEPNLSYEVTGFVTGETAANLDTAVAIARAQGEDVGLYRITVSEATAMNYDITFDNSIDFEITKALVTVIANDQSKIVGDALPNLTISYDGFVNGETAAVLDEAPVTSTMATEDSSVGDYVIALSSGADGNYEIEIIEGTLTILPDENGTVLPVKIKVGMSPNGDGINDTWVIKDIEKFPNSVLRIYSRSGNVIFQMKGYDNSFEGFSNKVNGSAKLPTGPYIYTIDFNTPGVPPAKGWMYINY